MRIGTPIVPTGLPIGTVLRPETITAENSDEVIATSYLGTPVYSNLIFDANPDTPENEDIRLDTVLFTVTQLRNIVKTEIQGRNGTVKEYINNGDYQIEVNGKVVSPEPLVKPVDQITALKNVFDLNSEIEVSSAFLNLFNIGTVVVEEYTFAEQAGYVNEVNFTVRMVSDEPIEILVNA